MEVIAQALVLKSARDILPSSVVSLLEEISETIQFCVADDGKFQGLIGFLLAWPSAMDK